MDGLQEQLIKAAVNVDLSEILRGLRRDRRKKNIFGTPPDS